MLLPRVITDGGRGAAHGPRRRWHDCGIRMISCLLSNGNPTADSYREAAALLAVEEKRRGRAGVPWTGNRINSISAVLNGMGFTRLDLIPFPEHVKHLGARKARNLRIKFLPVLDLSAWATLRFCSRLGIQSAGAGFDDHVVAIVKGSYYDLFNDPPLVPACDNLKELWIPESFAEYFEKIYQSERSGNGNT